MGYGNCCAPGYTIGRRYWTKDERTAWLKEYAESLENELKAVRERIEDIQQE